MSIKLMSLVWDSCIPTSKKMALLAMCDWADDNGGSVHPSIARLAKKISCSERQAQRIVHLLIDDGLVSVIGNAGGGMPGQTRRYQINVRLLHALATGVKLSPLPSAPDEAEEVAQTGDKLTPVKTARRVTNTTETGDTGVTLSPMYPSFNTPLPPEGGVCGFEEFWQKYPKKHGQEQARRQWKKLLPDALAQAQIAQALAQQAASSDWQREAGRFVPMASKWLAGRRWLDVPAASSQGEAAPDYADTRAGVEQLAQRLGLPAWDQLAQQWPAYKAGVVAAQARHAGGGV